MNELFVVVVSVFFKLSFIVRFVFFYKCPGLAPKLILVLFPGIINERSEFFRGLFSRKI